jgi:hypothetical protein
MGAFARPAQAQQGQVFAASPTEPNFASRQSFYYKRRERTQIIIQSIISRQSRCSKQFAAYVVTAALGCQAEHSSARFLPKAQWETFCPE